MAMESGVGDKQVVIAKRASSTESSSRSNSPGTIHVTAQPSSGQLNIDARVRHEDFYAIFERLTNKSPTINFTINSTVNNNTYSKDEESQADIKSLQKQLIELKQKVLLTEEKNIEEKDIQEQLILSKNDLEDFKQKLISTDVKVGHLEEKVRLTTENVKKMDPASCLETKKDLFESDKKNLYIYLEDFKQKLSSTDGKVGRLEEKVRLTTETVKKMDRASYLETKKDLCDSDKKNLYMRLGLSPFYCPPIHTFKTYGEQKPF